MNIKWFNSVTKARKAYNCIICRKPILKGNPYVSATGINKKGKPYTIRFHSECETTFEDWTEQLWDNVISTYEL